MCNQNYRTFFAPGAAAAEARRAARDACCGSARLAIKQRASAAPTAGKGVREAELVDGRWLQISERRTAEGGLVVTAADITALKPQEEARRLNEDAAARARSTTWSAARSSSPNWPASTRPRRSAPRAPTRPRASSWPI